MATNLEKLRAKKAANQQKETDLSTSFSIDEGVDAPPVAEEAPKAEAVPVEKVPAKEVKAEPVKTAVTEDKPKAEALAKATKSSNTKDDSKDSKATNPIKASKPINNSSTTKNIEETVAGPEKNLGLRLASEEDKRYLNMAPLSKGMTKKAFFIELMQEEFASIKDIDVNDPEIEQFRNSSLKTTAITISVPEDLIEQIKLYSAKHMMKYQRYVAYVISKARNNDPAWK